MRRGEIDHGPDKIYAFFNVKMDDLMVLFIYLLAFLAQIIDKDP